MNIYKNDFNPSKTKVLFGIKNDQIWLTEQWAYTIFFVIAREYAPGYMISGAEATHGFTNIPDVTKVMPSVIPENEVTFSGDLMIDGYGHTRAIGHSAIGDIHVNVYYLSLILESIEKTSIHMRFYIENNHRPLVAVNDNTRDIIAIIMPIHNNNK